MTQPSRDEDFVPRRPLSASPMEDTQPHVGFAIDPDLHQPSRYFDTLAEDDVDDAIEESVSHEAPPVEAPEEPESKQSKKKQKKNAVKFRRARLRLVHVSPWSVMKLSFLLSVALGIVTVIAVWVIWNMMAQSGLFDSINSTVGQVVNSGNGPGFDIRNYVGTDRVVGIAMLISVADVVLLTALSTLGAFLYNLAADLLGGFEVTLAEKH